MEVFVNSPSQPLKPQATNRKIEMYAYRIVIVLLLSVVTLVETLNWEFTSQLTIYLFIDIILYALRFFALVQNKIFLMISLKEGNTWKTSSGKVQIYLSQKGSMPKFRIYHIDHLAKYVIWCWHIVSLIDNVLD